MRYIGTYKTRAIAQRVATMRERKLYETAGFTDRCAITITTDGYAVFGY